MFGVRCSAFADHNRPVSIPHARSAGKQSVFICYVRIGMDRNRGNVQLTSKRSLIQCLNVFQAMLESIPAQIDLILGHGVKHERVVRVWGMSERKGFSAVVWLFFHLIEGCQDSLEELGAIPT
jgi:hypothetical protein